MQGPNIEQPSLLSLQYKGGPRGIHKQRDHKSEKGKRNIIDDNHGRLLFITMYSVNHQSGLQRNAFSKLSYIFLIHQNVPQIMSFHLRYMMVS